MVVYRRPELELPNISTSAQPSESLINEAEKSDGPRAILVHRSNSHPFQDRHVILDQPVKVGRAVARSRPTTSNVIFDCKVLSRNHALLWYENGKFFLQDTKSSNGTFVNNQRLSSGDDAPAKEVVSGDIVQFGVDVVENSRKVTHGCIVATLKLFLPDGKEAKASPSTPYISSVSCQDLIQLSQYLKEALHREQVLEAKLAALQKVVSTTKEASENNWKALIDEDRLISRIESLENQLICAKSVQEEKLHEEIAKLQEDRDVYQSTAKESLRKVLQEKLEALRKVQDLESSLSNVEEECGHLREMQQKAEKELMLLARINDDQNKEIASLSRKLKEGEEEIAKLNQDEEEEEDTKDESIAPRIVFGDDGVCNRDSIKVAQFDGKNRSSSNGVHLEEQGEDDDENYEKDVEKYSRAAKTQQLQEEVKRLQEQLADAEKDVECQGAKVEELMNDKNRLELELAKAREILTQDPGERNVELERLRELLAETRETKASKDEELVHLKGLLEDVQESSKESINEADHLRQRIQCLSVEPHAGDNSSEQSVNLQLECATLTSRIRSDRDLIEKHRCENAKLLGELRSLQETYSELESVLESRSGGAFWKDEVARLKKKADADRTELATAEEEILMLKERYAECNAQRTRLEMDLKAITDELQLISFRSKTVSICSSIPLLVLALTLLLAFYPYLSYLTATTDNKPT